MTRSWCLACKHTLQGISGFDRVKARDSVVDSHPLGHVLRLATATTVSIARMDAPTVSTSAPSASRLSKSFQTRLQYYLDKSTPHATWRWLGLLAFILIYAIRVYFLRGFYIVTYALGIYNLNLLLGFLSPQVDPELEGPALPSRTTDEYRPFIRRLPEFKFWCESSCCHQCT